METSMARRTSRAGIVAALLGVVLSGCSSGPVPDERSYVERVAAGRAAKDKMFSESSNSPIPPEKRKELLPLSYYPVDPSYSVPAALKLATERPVFEMPTSTGTIRKYQHVGTLEFSYKGQPLSLGAFSEAGTKQITSLFVPFADMTTGKETYFAGRYLDLEPTGTGIYEIDFNQAYNPYCAYNSGWECPYPPSSNRLKVPIQAGERMKSGK
jgi:uncharacterized protein (DUF1684 family)